MTPAEGTDHLAEPLPTGILHQADLVPVLRAKNKTGVKSVPQTPRLPGLSDHEQPGPGRGEEVEAGGSVLVGRLLVLDLHDVDDDHGPLLPPGLLAAQLPSQLLHGTLLLLQGGQLGPQGGQHT